MKEEFDGASFDEAARKAEKEFQEMYQKMSSEERGGLITVQSWLKKWYMSAGLKRLTRILRDFKG